MLRALYSFLTIIAEASEYEELVMVGKPSYESVLGKI